MDLQQIFYIIAIIFMVTFLLLIISIGVALYVVRKRVAQLTRLASRPAQTAAIMGAGLVEGLAMKFKEWTAPRK